MSRKSSTASQVGPAFTSTRSQWECDSPDTWPMETEVGGPTRRGGQVGELPGRCSRGIADPDAGKEGGCVDLSLAPSQGPSQEEVGASGSSVVSSGRQERTPLEKLRCTGRGFMGGGNKQ